MRALLLLSLVSSVALAQGAPGSPRARCAACALLPSGATGSDLTVSTLAVTSTAAGVTATFPSAASNCISFNGAALGSSCATAGENISNNTTDWCFGVNGTSRMCFNRSSGSATFTFNPIAAGYRVTDGNSNPGLFNGSNAGTTTNSINLRGDVANSAGNYANHASNNTSMTQGDDRYIQGWEPDGWVTKVARVTSAGTYQGQAGTSATLYPAATTAFVDTTARQPASCAGNVDFANPYSVPANALSATGKGVRFHFAGTTAANANAKTIRLQWGSQTLVSKQLTATTAGSWEIEGECHKSGASTQQCWARAFNNQGTTVALADGTTVLYQMGTLSGTQTDTATISLRVQEVTCTAASDITQTHARVSFDN